MQTIQINISRSYSFSVNVNKQCLKWGRLIGSNDKNLWMRKGASNQDDNNMEASP